VDTPGYEMLAGVKVERALPLWSDRLRLIGKADLVEFKHGRRRQKSHDDVQLAGQRQASNLTPMLARFLENMHN